MILRHHPHFMAIKSERNSGLTTYYFFDPNCGLYKSTALNAFARVIREFLAETPAMFMARRVIAKS